MFALKLAFGGVMALLTRYFHVNDGSDDSQVFNFVVTKSVTRDFSKKDVVSKDFSYGWHRWALSFSREDKVNSVRKCVHV